MIVPLLILYVATADVATPETMALQQAIEQVTGTAIAVQVRGLPTTADDIALERLGQAAGATAVARVEWTQGDRTGASIHARLLATGETLDRTVSFRPSDRPLEQARALGFILGSFVVPPPPPTAAGPPLTSHVEPAPVAPPAPPRRFALEAFLIGGKAVGGVGDGLGGGVGLRWPSDRSWGLRLGARARIGSIQSAESSLLAAAGYAGITRTLLGDRDTSVRLAVRADAVLFHEALTHFSDDDPRPVRQTRWLAGAAAALDVEWGLGSTAAVYLAVGGETTFGSSPIYVHLEKVAEMAPLRLLGEAGFRARF